MKNTIIMSMATHPQRKVCLQHTVNSVINQCDKLNIYLNNYTDIPEFLKHKKIMCYLGSDLGDVGKFYNITNEDGYFFTIDDDLIYPRDYTQRMIQRIVYHKHKAIIGVHGSTFNPLKMNSYYKDRSLSHYRASLAQERTVHLIGTGTSAFHTSTIKVRIEDFPKPNMADIWFALLAQKQNIPMILITRPLLWIKDAPEATNTSSIYTTSKGKSHGSYQTEIIKQYHNWRLIGE